MKTYPNLGILIIIILIAPTLNTGFYGSTIHAQIPQGASSAISQICDIVQQNGLLAALAGLGEALAICTGMDTLNSTQALKQLCSAVSGLGIINVESICDSNEVTSTNQTQNMNTTNPVDNKEKEPQSFIERLLGFIFK